MNSARPACQPGSRTADDIAGAIADAARVRRLLIAAAAGDQLFGAPRSAQPSLHPAEDAGAVPDARRHRRRDIAGRDRRTRATAGASETTFRGRRLLACGLAALLPPTTNGTDRIALSFILAVGVGLIGMVDILPVDIALPGQEG